MLRLFFAPVFFIVLLSVVSSCASVVWTSSDEIQEKKLDRAAADEARNQKDSDERQKLLLLFSGVTAGLPPSWRPSEPLHKWVGIKTDERGRVDAIVVATDSSSNHEKKLSGSLHSAALQSLDRLFPELWMLDLNGHLLSGDFNFKHLPKKLRILDLQSGRAARDEPALTGALDTSALPDTLTELNLAYNSFSNPPKQNFDWKPLLHLDRLTMLSLSFNDFSAPSVEFDKLPRSLTFLGIAGLNFFGVANLSHLPRGITHLQLHMQSVKYVIDDLTSFPISHLDAESAENLAQVRFVVNGASFRGDVFWQKVVRARATDDRTHDPATDADEKDVEMMKNV